MDANLQELELMHKRASTRGVDGCRVGSSGATEQFLFSIKALWKLGETLDAR